MKLKVSHGLSQPRDKVWEYHVGFLVIVPDKGEERKQYNRYGLPSLEKFLEEKGKLPSTMRDLVYHIDTDDARLYPFTFSTPQDAFEFEEGFIQACKDTQAYWNTAAWFDKQTNKEATFIDIEPNQAYSTKAQRVSKLLDELRSLLNE